MIQSDLFKCPICYLEYDSAQCIPKILPACGHTLCSKCLDQILKTQPAKCPLDRNIIDPKLKTSTEFTTLRVLTQLMDERAKMQYGICLIHQEPKNLLCMTDKTKICQSCVHGKDDAAHKGHDTKPLSDIFEQVKSKTTQLKSQILNMDSHHQKVFDLLEETKNETFKLKKRKFDEIRDFVDKAEHEVWSEIGLIFGHKKTKTEDQFKKDEELKERIKLQMSTLERADLDEAFFSALDQEISHENQHSKQEEHDIYDLSKKIEDQLEIVHTNISKSIVQYDPKIEFFLSKEGQLRQGISSLLSLTNRGPLLKITHPSLPIKDKDINFKEFQATKSVKLDLRGEKMKDEIFFALCFLWRELKDITALSVKLKHYENTNKEYSMFFEQNFWASEKIERFKLSSFTFEDLPEGHSDTESLTESIFKSLSRMTNLKSLYFSLPFTETPDKTLISFTNQVLPCLRNLEVFKLDLRHTWSTDAGLKEVWLKAKESFKKIIAFSLKVGCYSKITTKFLNPLIQNGLPNFINLEKFSLDLSCLASSSQDDLHNFWIPCGSMSKNIKSFSCSMRRTGVTDFVLKSFAKNMLPFMFVLEKLKLDLTDCRKITDSSLNSLSRNLSKSNNLKALKLRFASELITNNGVKFWQEICFQMSLSLKYWS